jgi:hypothetical protein
LSTAKAKIDAADDEVAEVEADLERAVVAQSDATARLKEAESQLVLAKSKSGRRG